MHHFSNWTDYDIKELWMLSGQGRSSRAIPLHQLVNTMDSTVIEVLPAVHALSGCDTTSKIGTKKSAFQTAEKSGEEYLKSFGKSVLTEEMVCSAEKFLADCLSNDKKLQTFDELRFQTYHKKTLQLDFEKLPCTSNSIHRHIKRAFLQCYRWLHAPFMETIDLNPTDYGYIIDDNEHLIPEIVEGPVTPDDFPLPCNCIKCAKSTVCPCRVRDIPCCEFCKCNASVSCKNPAN